MGGDAEACVRLADAAVEHILHVEIARDRGDVPLARLQLHRRGSGDHAQSPDFREIRNDLVGETVREVRVAAIGTQVFEWQHNDRFELV